MMMLDTGLTEREPGIVSRPGSAASVADLFRRLPNGESGFLRGGKPSRLAESSSIVAEARQVELVVHVVVSQMSLANRSFRRDEVSL